MTGKRPDPFSRRLTDQKHWRQQPANLQRLEAACKVCKVRTADARHLLTVLVVATDKHSGTVAQSISQLADETGLPVFTVRRALKALETAAVISTVWRGHPAADGKGRPSGRRVLFLTVDNSPENGKTVHSDDKTVHSEPKDRALDSERPCTQVHATMSNTSMKDTSMKDTSMRLAISENETETEKGKGAQNEPDWSSLVTSAITQLIVNEASNIHSPDGFRYATQSKVRKMVFAVENDYGAGIRQISPAHYDWSSLVAVVRCRFAGEAVSMATSDALQKAANIALTT